MEVKHQKHLINILKSTSEHHPNYTIFLGAGASATSNVKLASEMISEWQASYKDMHGYDEDDDLKKGLFHQSWHNTTLEYSQLFESLYDQPSQRREYIESCLNEAKPSWGYIYLVNLLKNKVFNTIFTTNFDDLVNEACYTFSSGLRPIVSAHDSSIRSVRLTSHRPKIIKLHGDFLFDNIKNTVRELESLEGNMREKFKQFASEFGMIVIGYAGNDRSIMETLNLLLHTNTNFKHGIYWCIRKGTNLDELPNDLKNLARFPHFHLVEIDGFDEFMAEVHHDLGCELQDEVASPYDALAKKIDETFINGNDDKNKNQIIQNDFKLLTTHITKIKAIRTVLEKVEGLLNESEDDSSELVLKLNDIGKEMTELSLSKDGYATPLAFLAQAAYKEKDYLRSLDLCFKGINDKVTPNLISIAINNMVQLKDYSSFEELKPSFKQLTKLTDKDFSLLLACIVDLISEEEYLNSIFILKSIKKFINKSSTNYSYYELNHALAIRLMNEDINEEGLRSLNEALEREAGQNNFRLIFALGVVLGNDTLAVDIIPHMDIEDLADIYHSNMPIKKLFSTELNATIEKIIGD